MKVGDRVLGVFTKSHQIKLSPKKRLTDRKTVITVKEIKSGR
jgi:hypothetical protein